MKDIIVKSGMEIDLGKRGEHLARCVVFDISNWQKTYGEGSVHLLHQRNGDKAPYPCVVETDGTFVRWLLSETDVDVAGRGRAELQYFVDEARVKSETWNTRTNRSMNNEGPIPEEPAENWLNTMLQLGTETQENAEIAEQNAEIAEQSAAEAKSSAQNAIDCENLVYEHAQDARAASENATAAMNAAEAAQTAAEQARDEAQAIAGGDVASTVYVNSQISAHNSNTAAHADIRQSVADHIGNKNNPHGVTAAQVGARPSTWMPTAADVGAAPAYTTKSMNDCTTLKEIFDLFGYNYSVRLTGGIGQLEATNLRTLLGSELGVAFHTNYLGVRAELVSDRTILLTAVDSTSGDDIADGYIHFNAQATVSNFTGWRTSDYRIVDGIVEWINPPMQLGVEYRTTERCEGKPVYAKYVDGGYYPNATSKTINIANNAHVFQVYGYQAPANINFGGNLASTLQSSLAVGFFCSGEYVVIACGGDRSNVECKFFAKYTKTTD